MTWSTTISAAPKIQDYAIIGDGRSAALVSRQGSIDWLCWPRFDSPSLFGRLLDRQVGGSFAIAPTEPARIDRRYIEHTNVLQTRFQTGSGAIVLTDFMPAASEEEKARTLWPEQELVRRVECEQGEVEIRADFDPRPDYGRAKASIRDAGMLGHRLAIKAGLITLRSQARFSPAAESGVTACARLKAKESMDFSHTLAAEGPTVLPPLGESAIQKLALTTE